MEQSFAIVVPGVPVAYVPSSLSDPNNERVELAMQILECRRKLRQAGRDQIEIEKLRAEIARLEQELREIARFLEPLLRFTFYRGQLSTRMERSSSQGVGSLLPEESPTNRE
jgi:predicted RNase H-like nuclease (RuvC/YqgF family)